MLGIHIKGNNI